MTEDMRRKLAELATEAAKLPDDVLVYYVGMSAGVLEAAKMFKHRNSGA